MKTIIFAILACSFSISASESESLPQIRRAPYKEVRSKANHDPEVREAKRKEMERKQKAKEEDRKKAEASKRGGWTNSVSSPKPPTAPASVTSSRPSTNSPPSIPKPK
jgi:hypothetical protein